MTRAEYLLADLARVQSQIRSARAQGRQLLTYGNLPARAEFSEAFRRECPDGRYAIRHGSATPPGSHRPLADDYSESELWAELERLTDVQDFDVNDAGEWAGDILSTLGWEWV